MKMLQTVLMEKMAWPEIRRALDDHVTTALVIGASIEQHGPHLPIETDTLLAYDTGERVARRLGDALVAPVIRPGCSDHHLGLPGTLSLPRRVFEETLAHYAANLAGHGFRWIVLIPSHGGNNESIFSVASTLKSHYAACGVGVFACHADTTDLRAQLLAQAGLDNAVGGIHAGHTETSLMMAAFPQAVRRDEMKAGFLGEVDIARVHSEGVVSISPNGVFGDPRSANAEFGERLRDYHVDVLVEKIRQARKLPM